MSPLLTHCDPSVPIGHLSEASSSYWRKDGDLGTFSSLMEEEKVSDAGETTYAAAAADSGQ